ncbi:MAG TPA: radical SAM protein, partial [Stellaceae bacterium]|nr:radical SAM protein [Stellaceae bacterium]
MDHRDDPIPDDYVPLPVPDMPQRVLLDLATRCNLRCPMCTVWGSGDNDAIDAVKGSMDLDAARRLLNEITGTAVLIQPNMWGEPLLAPKIRERISDIKARGLTVAMNTNGLTLTEELARFFVEVKLDSIFFSIDAVTKETLKKIRGITKLEKIEAAVHRMLAARGEAEHPRIGV